MTTSLSGTVALVTGASRGVGRGIARGLGEAGATVYVTGRTVQRGPTAEPGTIEHVAREVDALGGKGIPVRCDHRVAGEIRALFDRIEGESGRLDLLVNNVHSGLQDIADSLDKRFWEIEPDQWDRMNDAGLRGHYVASVYAARMMVRRRAGLIINVSSIGAASYLFSVAYGVGKAALDRLTRDMAVELRKDGVAVVSLWPGLVRTELTSAFMEDARHGLKSLFDAISETPLLSGRAVAALAADPRILRKSGRVLVAAEVVRRHGLRDEDGARPVSLRSFRMIAKGVLPDRWQRLAVLVPPVRAPLFLVVPALTRFSETLKEKGGHLKAGPSRRTAV